jgi:hypothetical protein
MSLPIITFSLNDRDYLAYVLAQAKISNPESDVILLGYESNDKYEFITHDRIDNYARSAFRFSHVYQHFNTNSLWFELWCFQRWFVLKDFMIANHIEKCLCIDSDIMLYADVTEEQKKFAKFGLTGSTDWCVSNPLLPNASFHCGFINDLKELEIFCEFIFEIYTNSELLKTIQATWQECLRNNWSGGVSDMLAFCKFAAKYPDRVGEMAEIIDGSRYDHNINLSEDFEMNNGIKNIYFIDNIPFAKHIISGEEIKFNSLHFQGYAKKYIKDYFRGELIVKSNLKWLIRSNFYNTTSTSDENFTNKYPLNSNDFNQIHNILPFKLSLINLIIFPNWQLAEETIIFNLEQIIKSIAIHPNASHITLLIYQNDLYEEDVRIALSTAMMNLLMQEDMAFIKEPEIVIVGDLDEIQWLALLSGIHARISLANENLLLFSSFLNVQALINNLSSHQVADLTNYFH